MQGAPKLKVAIVGGGLAGLSTAVELLDQGYDVDIYEQRPFIGGKVASYKDRSGNHVEMGLHVFFGWVVCTAVHVWLQPAHWFRPSTSWLRPHTLLSIQLH